MSREKVPLNMHKMDRFRSFCACAKYHLGLCSPFIHFVVSNDSVSGQQKPWSAWVDAHADLGLHCLHMPEDMFSHGTAHFKNWFINIQRNDTLSWVATLVKINWVAQSFFLDYTLFRRDLVYNEQLKCHKSCSPCKQLAGNLPSIFNPLKLSFRIVEDEILIFFLSFQRK